MDALNHVNHTVFIRWMETARMHYFIACGFSDLFDAERIGPILAGLKVDYNARIEFPDTVTVHTTVTRIGNASFEMEYRITSSAKGDETVATGTVSGVVFDYNSGSSTPMPDSLRASILQLEATGSG
jgi:acyl-CoA thioester hydrolase